MDSMRGFSIVPFVEARAREMEALTQIVTRPDNKKRVFQNLPRHMRRRAMSHNIKRLPRRLHMAAKAEMDKQCPPAKNKRPSRKHRRRPRNLMLEYIRRQRKHVWLETHIWHAKRFKMADLWSHRIPLSPNDKGERAAYRATAKHCLLQDISYHGCIELCGPEAKIIEGLTHFTNTEIGLTVAAKSYLNGSRHGTAMLYEKDSYPFGAISPVSFLWRSTADIHYSAVVNHGKSGTTDDDLDSGRRQLWLWVHPSCFSKVLEELNSVFNVLSGDKISKSCAESGTDATSRTSGSQSVSVGSLKNSLLRFRLTGPLSQAVLNDTLKPANVEKISDDCKRSVSWWSSYYSTTETKAFHSHQTEIWSSLQGVLSPAEASSNCVLSCTVRDPRIFLPRKRVKVMPNASDFSTENMLIGKKLPPEASASPLWDAEVRDQVKATKMTEQALNKCRSELLVPGSQLELGDEESRIPVILLQRPGRRENHLDGVLSKHTNKDGMLGYGCGWDILLPAGWGMAFWVALIYRGARAGGLKEMKATASLAGVPHFPDDMPDTAAGKIHESSEKEKLEAKYSARPPAKRPNYTKLGTPAPFHFPWKQLVNEWKSTTSVAFSGSESDMEVTNQIETKEVLESRTDVELERTSFTVLRARKQLRLLQRISVPGLNGNVRDKRKQPRHNLSQKSVSHSKIEATSSEQFDLDYQQLTLNVQFYGSLVPVLLNMVMRGTAKPFSMVCIPSQEDLFELKKDHNYGGPLEPLHKDPNKQKNKKKQCNKEKPASGSFLDADMKRVLNQASIGPLSSSTKTETQYEKEGKKDAEKDCPKSENSVVDQNSTTPYETTCCSRKIIGFVKNGGYALASGHGAGLAFCAYVGLLDLLKSKKLNDNCIVLVRSPQSLQYRFAYLSVAVQ